MPVLNDAANSYWGSNPVDKIMLGSTEVWTASTVASRAVALWKASDADDGRVLKDLSGKRHHLYAGSTKVAAILDGRLELTGIAGSYASTPSQAALEITGDIDIRVLVRPDGYVGIQSMVAKRGFGGSADVRAWAFAISANNQLQLQVARPDGTLNLTNITGSDLSTEQWVRVTRRVSDGLVQFFTSPDGVAWTQYGTDQIVEPGQALNAGPAAPVMTGAYADGNSGLFQGYVKRAIIKDGIDGTTVFDADFTSQPDYITSFVESTGKTVTVNQTAVTTNDPKYLPFDSAAKKYLRLPGRGNNYASTPDHADLNITGDLDIRVDLSLDDWTPGVVQSVISKYSTSDNQRSYWLRIVASGAISLITSEDGINTLFSNSGPVPASDGQRLWIRVTRDADDGAGNRITKFFTSSDGNAWTQLGGDLVQTAATIHSGPALFELGARGATNEPLTGKIYRAQVRNGIDGTVVFDADFSDASVGASSFNDKTNKPVTINTSGSPAARIYSEGQYIYLPGTSENSLSVPDEAALDLAGDIDLRAHATLPDWTPGVEKYLIDKNTFGSFTGYALALGGDGKLRFRWDYGGPDHTFLDSTVSVPFSDGAAGWVRGVLDVDNGAGGHTATFFTSSDGLNWTQLGLAVTAAGTTSVANDAGTLLIGSGASLLEGRVYRAQVYDGINGTLVLDIDTSMADPAVTTFHAKTGQTVTINRAASGPKTTVVDRSMFLFGTDDYMEAFDHPDLDFGANESFGAVAAARFHGAIASTSRLLMKKTTGSILAPGWALRFFSSGTGSYGPLFSDGTVQPTADMNVAARASIPTLWGAVRDVPSDVLRNYADGSELSQAQDTTTGSLDTSAPLRVGANSHTTSPGEFWDGEFFGAGIFREALTAADIARLAAELNQSGV